ncbi:DUF2380 domain-containing protein [Myxococcus sp. CA040A]|uniref:DUF2380 domain-containing protein n=3 Tax=Myxococcaceae TaxID=31 RepID=A0A540X635_9BACT|nr:DUF2380 domain-containing protein [Myxococcus sp. CA040A]NTX04762.1 DUF2380 domain-containing protein [Myxococcus sp. CA040A]TQF16726.1 DUF2380 domain-containing protein [Myxococcus llanfairpwllgwyngyllgogerychwyrndrobwllllantysiliogogogochensis]
MRVDALLWVVALLTAGCSSVTQVPGRGETLSYTPRQWRHATPRADATRAGPGTTTGAVGGERQSAERTHQALLDSINEAKGSLKGVESALSKMVTRRPGFDGRSINGEVFTRFLHHGDKQATWIRGALESTTGLTEVASEVGDPAMELGILRMTGPKLQAAMFGTLLLATWGDFLQLSDALLRECFMCGIEKQFVDLNRVRGLMETALADLASQDPDRVEAAALGMPELMGTLTREFNTLRSDGLSAIEDGGKVLVAMQVLEMVTLISSLKMSLPRLPPATPATLGVGLTMSSGGVMAGSRIVVSAEWVEMMRRLVQAGVISVPAVSAAVRIHGGQVMMAQAHQGLPKGVRDALGDSPEVRGMQVTGRAGAGMSEAPKHHVMPKEHREWFEQRGFKGDLDIDQFCVRLERAHHEAIHGGGNWKLGRIWPDEWNRRIMRTLNDAELSAGQKLTRNEVLSIVAENMRLYDIPMKFTKGRSR